MAGNGGDGIELGYEVSRTVPFPNLADVSGVSRVGPPVEQGLEAVHFDTSALDLARHGVTLLRRAGGEDAGWQLALPADGDGGTDVRWPLTEADQVPDQVPEALLGLVRALVRDRPVGPVARIRTRRREYPLLGSEDRTLAWVCDDEVEAEVLDRSGAAEQWREWRIRAAEADGALLDGVATRLAEAGAAPGAARSELSRVLGDTVPHRRDRPSRIELARGTVGQLFAAVLAEQVARLHRRDVSFRRERPGSVHKLRICTRRLRSALRTYRPILDRVAVDSLCEELRWLGESLGRARDAEVQREHLLAVLASEPTELVLGPVAARIDRELRAAYRAGVEHGKEALETDRYFRLLEALDELVGSPPFTARADRTAREAVPRLLRRDLRKVEGEVERLRRAQDDRDRDEALHSVRKKAKRLRYAAESAEPVLGPGATRLARRAKRVHEVLGVHQDSVVTRRLLREYGVRAHLDGDNGFTFGRLHGLEQSRGERAQRDLRSAVKRLTSKKARRWVSG